MRKILVSALLSALIITAVLTANGGEAAKKMETAKDATYIKKDGTGVIYLAGGCFWGMEKYMESIRGVTSAVAGYANGHSQGRPTYEQVCTNTTGYRETVRVEYDKSKTSLEKLLYGFFSVIDPTIRDRQGNDRGSQYQSGIYWTDEASAAAVKRVAATEEKRWGKLAVELKPLEIFWEAEEYHQNYLTKHPGGYCHVSREELEAAKKMVVDPGKYKRPSDEEIKKKLTPLQYKVTQQEGTEPPFENEYWQHDKHGIYVDVVTGEPLFSSKDKYKTSCGWPGFTKPLDENAAVYKTDRSFGMERTEVKSRVGNSHLGHVFQGDPESPNGVRYCIDSAALRFVPYEKMDAEGYGEFKKFVK